MKNYRGIADCLQIKKDFGLQAEDVSELRKQLKELLKDIHPDINNGQFKSRLDELNYERIISAIDFLNQDFALIPKTELTALATIIKENFPAQKEEAQLKTLQDRIDNTIKSYKESNLFPRISSTVAAAVVTFIWDVPSTAKEHPILSKYITSGSLMFTAIWMYTLILTAGLELQQ